EDRNSPLTCQNVELRGLEPLASCMPCLTSSSGMVRDGQGHAGQTRFAIWPGQESTGVGWARSHLVSHWPGQELERWQMSRPHYRKVAMIQGGDRIRF